MDESLPGLLQDGILRPTWLFRNSSLWTLLDVVLAVVVGRVRDVQNLSGIPP